MPIILYFSIYAVLLCVCHVLGELVKFGTGFDFGMIHLAETVRSESVSKELRDLFERFSRLENIHKIRLANKA
jgi:hypothetical protein